MNLNQDLKVFKKTLPKRKKSSHKGDFGRLLILSGSKRMVGCAVLSAQAALRSGAGVLTLGFPKTLYSVLTRRLTESLFFPLPETKQGSLSLKSYRPILEYLKTQDVLALGPGMSREKETQGVIRKLIVSVPHPLVIDADALFAFSGRAKELKRIQKGFVLTPHAVEFERLFGFKSGKTDRERKDAARAASLISGGVVVLKGHRTVVAEGKKKVFVNRTGNPGLATGGTGDVLFGLVSSFLGQGLEPFKAACLGVFLHGLSADLAVKKIPEASLLASDLIEYLPLALKKLK